jgi:squalene-associated FAD-dependent desaturase
VAENGMAEHVVVVGAGLAGLAATTALAERGFRVTLLESRGRLGGRASSFTDAVSGQLVDTCQHVSMGCCTNLAHFCRTVGVAHLLQAQPCLYFMTPDRRVSRFRADCWPAPLHLARSFLGAHYLSPAEKLRIAWGLFQLQIADRRLEIVRKKSAIHNPQSAMDDDPPFRDWLTRHGQTPRTVERFWGLVLVSALNEVPERIGLRYARKVFLDGFLRHRRGFEVEVPAVPLARLYGEELQAWLERHQVRLQLNRAAKAFRVSDGSVRGVQLRDGATLEADWYVSAVPFDRLLDALPGEVVDAHPYFGNLRQLETSPITSVHVWYDRPVLGLPHVVLVGCAGQWVFNRGESSPGEHYLQVVVSAARQFRGLGRDEVQRQIVEELARLFSDAAAARVLRARVVTEHAATFSAVPGVDRWRPPQASPLGNLFVAGDWTATGWPATMEGAVRSGYLAAEGLLARVDRKERLIQPELGGR